MTKLSSPKLPKPIAHVVGVGILVATAVFECYFVLLTDSWIVARAVALSVIVSCTFTLTVTWVTRRHNKDLDVLGHLPRNVTFSREDEDGAITALVTCMNGEPRVLTIPEEVADGGPQAAMTWILHELAP